MFSRTFPLGAQNYVWVKFEPVGVKVCHKNNPDYISHQTIHPSPPPPLNSLKLKEN